MPLRLSALDSDHLKISPSGIYAISRVGDYRCYIGSAAAVCRRVKQHVHLLTHDKHHSKRLQRAVNKHGLAAFEIFLIESVPNKEDLLSREQWWINLLAAARAHGYNCSPTAGNQLGTKHSEETRAKLSAANRGKTLSDEHRAKLSAALLGKPRSAETRAKLSAANRGKTVSAETRAKLSAAQRGENNPNFGKTLNAETRAKMSAAHHGKTLSDEHRAKLSANNPMKNPEVATKAATTRRTNREAAGLIKTPEEKRAAHAAWARAYRAGPKGEELRAKRRARYIRKKFAAMQAEYADTFTANNAACQ